MVNLSNLTYIMNSISVIVFIMLYAVRIHQQCNELVFNLFSITGDSNMENMGKNPEPNYKGYNKGIWQVVFNKLC